MPDEDNVHRAVASLRELASLETETLAAEINLLGVLRDRIASAARYGDPIPIKFRKLQQETESASEQVVFLPEGYPFTETGRPLPGLLVIDRYGEFEITAEGDKAGTLAWKKAQVLLALMLQLIMSFDALAPPRLVIARNIARMAMIRLTLSNMALSIQFANAPNLVGDAATVNAALARQNNAHQRAPARPPEPG